MKINLSVTKIVLVLFVTIINKAYSQVPVGNFSISPVPICTGNGNVYQITDLSTGAPTAWSYTVRGGGGGPGPGAQPTVSTVQNPTISFNNQGTYTISLIVSNASGAGSIVTKTIAVLQSPNAVINPQNPSTCAGSLPINIQVQTGGGPGGGPVTYSWSTGATTNVISVTASVTTVYSCVITGTNGCSVTRSATLSIANPTATIVSVPASICPGTTSTLTANSNGPGPYVFVWSDNTTNNSTTSSVTGVYTATVINGLGCSSVATYTLGSSSTLSLTPSSTPSILCSGNTATLNVTGAGNYTWSNGSTVNNPTVNPTSNANFTVVGQIGNCIGAAVLTLSVNNLPTVSVVSNPTAVCAGQSVTLTATGATSYTWLPSNVISNTLVVSPNLSGNITVRGQNPGCAARNGTINLTVNPSPVVSIFASSSSMCAGEALALSVVGANSYTWSNGANGAVVIVYPTSTGAISYNVSGANSSNCIGTATVNLNVLECTSLKTNTILSNALQLFPNPASEFVNLQSEQALSVDIYNVSGQLLKHVLLNQENNFSSRISGLHSGIYLIKYNTGSSTQTGKLIVE